jgi:hypothetical protein
LSRELSLVRRRISGFGRRYRRIQSLAD